MIVTNSSCLIILQRLGKQDLLEEMFHRIVIPRAVSDEVFGGKDLPPWIEMREIQHPLSLGFFEKSLGKGESEAITLALELKADLLIVDDLAARLIAEKAGIKITGVIGVLLIGKKRGLIKSVKDAMDEMIKKDFRISEETYKSALVLAREERDTLKEETSRIRFPPE
jgi:uncharacterized protein